MEIIELFLQYGLLPLAFLASLYQIYEWATNLPNWPPARYLGLTYQMLQTIIYLTYFAIAFEILSAARVAGEGLLGFGGWPIWIDITAALIVTIGCVAVIIIGLRREKFKKKAIPLLLGPILPVGGITGLKILGIL